MEKRKLDPPYNHPNPIEAYSGKELVHKILGSYYCECGCEDFTIYFGEYLTIVKCKNCKFEYCVHEG